MRDLRFSSRNLALNFLRPSENSLTGYLSLLKSPLFLCACLLLSSSIHAGLSALGSLGSFKENEEMC